MSAPYEDRPSGKMRAVTPSDSADLPDGQTRGLYIGSISGGAGMSVIDATGATVTIAGLVAGAVYPFKVRRVRSSGTTASSILALY